MKRISVKEAITRFSKLAEEDSPVIVENRGKPVVLIVPLNEKVRDSYPELMRQVEIVRLLEEAKKSNISLEELAAILRKRTKNGS